MPTMVEITKRRRERRVLALKLHREGKSLREVGAELGVGKERARCLIESGKQYEQRNGDSL